MKRIICAIIVLTLVASILVGCAPAEKPVNNSGAGTVTNEPEPEGPVDISDFPYRDEIIGKEYLAGIHIIYFYDSITQVVYKYTYHQKGYSGGGSIIEVRDIEGNLIPYDVFIEQYKTLN